MLPPHLSGASYGATRLSELLNWTRADLAAMKSAYANARKVGSVQRTIYAVRQGYDAAKSVMLTAVGFVHFAGGSTQMLHTPRPFAEKYPRTEAEELFFTVGQPRASMFPMPQFACHPQTR